MQERVVIPVHNGRVSPVLDVARCLVLVEADDGKEVARTEQRVDVTVPHHRAKWLLDHAVNVVICGAISFPLATLIQSYGIQLYPSIVGGLEDVIEGYLTGALQQPQFIMPGCCGRRKRFQRGRRQQSR